MKTFKKIVKFFFCKVFYRVEFIGRENIDFKKSNMLVANHVSGLDGIFIWSDISNLRIMAKEELFKSKIMAWFLTKVGVFRVARGKKDFSHVLQAVKVLKDKEKQNLLIFPEGTRNARLKDVKPKIGAVYIAKSANVKVIPIHITEKFRLFGKVKIEYLKPVTLNIKKEELKDKKILREETERIMDLIYDRSK